ncbi:hypothetical protein LCER1_G009020, partial [Lachnellula cervina]
MTSIPSPETIRTRLQAFISDSQSLAPNIIPTTLEPLTILYGQTHLGLPLHAVKLRDIEAGRGAPEYKECEVLLRGDMHGHVLFQTTIHNSTLRDCILVACTIYGGKMEKCQLTDCRVRKKALGENDTSPTTPFISCCNLEGGNAYDAEIFNSTLNNVSPIQSCDIDNSLAIHSLGFDSTFGNCGIHDSKLHNCKTVGGVKDSVVETKNTMNFRRFPTEIRNMIFSSAIQMDGLSTGLIAALRPDSLLYSEVLEAFYREHVFVLSHENQEVFRSALQARLQGITKIYLKGITALPTSDVSIYFPVGTHLTSITVEFQGKLINIQKFYDITKMWLKYFGSVLQFTVVWKDIRPWKVGDCRLPPDPPEALKAAIKVANKWLKTDSSFFKGMTQERKQVKTTHSNPGMFRGPIAVLGPELETFTWTWTAHSG